MAIQQVFFDLNGTLFDPAVMAKPLSGEDAEQSVEEILREAVLLSMAESYGLLPRLLRAPARGGGPAAWR